jgi:hypothetical protein
VGLAYPVFYVNVNNQYYWCWGKALTSHWYKFSLPINRALVSPCAVDIRYWLFETVECCCGFLPSCYLHLLTNIYILVVIIPDWQELKTNCRVCKQTKTTYPSHTLSPKGPSFECKSTTQ